MCQDAQVNKFSYITTRTSLLYATRLGPLSGRSYQIKNVEGLSCLNVPEPDRAISATRDQRAARDLHPPHSSPVTLVGSKALLRVGVPGLDTVVDKQSACPPHDRKGKLWRNAARGVGS